MSDTGIETHTHSGSPLKALTQKVGPLPGYAWVIIAVGGYLAYRWYRNKNAAPPAAIQDTGTTTDSSTSAAPVTGGASFGGGSIGGGLLSGVSGAPSVSTNAQWSSMVASQLIAGGDNPTDVENALANYLAGNPLTPTQQAIVNTALQKYGQPPEGVLPVSTQPTAPTYSTTNPPPGTTWVRDASANNGAGQVYQRWPDGSSYALTNAQYSAYVAAHGTPAYTTVNAKPTTAPKPSTAPVSHAPAPAPKPVSQRTYVVKSGDTLWAIATRYYGNGADYTRIQSANHLSGTTIHPGQTLVIP